MLSRLRDATGKSLNVALIETLVAPLVILANLPPTMAASVVLLTLHITVTRLSLRVNVALVVMFVSTMNA